MRDFSILSAVVDDLKDIQTCADTVTNVPDCTICLNNCYSRQRKKTEARGHLLLPLSLLSLFPVRN